MFDPFPTRLLLDFSHSFIDVIVRIISLTFSTASFPVAFKSAVVKPLLKKPTLDSDILKNFRPVSNLPYLSKLILKVIAIRLVKHMTQNTIMEKFQSAYKGHHSTDTALLRVYNDIMFNIDRGNGTLLVLLDLSAAFDTIDHQIVFHILEHSLGITDSALALMKSYLDGRQQCVQIDGVISEFAKLACGVPQGLVLGPLKFYIYMLPIGSIMRHHDIDFHIYADDTQLYVSFDLSNPNVALDRMNVCISDLRIWMIRNKQKINYSKTEFLIITSAFLKQSCDDINIMVGDSNIVSSNSARNFGVIFDKCMKLDYHISSVCKSTYFHLRNIGGIRNIISNDACAQLIHSLVTVRLDYCNSMVCLITVCIVYRKFKTLLQEFWLVYLDFHIFRLHCLTCTGYQLGTESRLKFVF